MDVEQANQPVETTASTAEAEPIDFGDDESTETASTDETAKAETEPEAEPEKQETAETETVEAPEESYLDITYNGEAKKLSKEEAKTLAQKGMNYDKIYQKLQEHENDPVMKIFKAQADSVNMSLNDYAQRLSQFQEQSAIQQIADDFMAEHPEVSEEAAKSYANAEYKNQQIAKASQQAQQTQAQTKAEQDSLVKEVQSFSQRYPDVKIEQLPTEVIDDINSGASLETAWLRYQNSQLNTRVKNEALNKTNKQKNVGKVSSNVAESGGDSFLEGLLGK